MGIRRLLVSPRRSLGVLKLKLLYGLYVNIWIYIYIYVILYIHTAYACTVQQYYIFVVQPFFLEIIESDK